MLRRNDADQHATELHYTLKGFAGFVPLGKFGVSVHTEQM